MTETHTRMDRVATILQRAVDWTEVIVAAVLAFIIVLAVAMVVYSTVGLVGGFPHNEAGFSYIIKSVLDVFIIIELFRITIAYVRHRDVIGTVLETALVVAAREIVVIEAGAKDPQAGLAIAGILLAIGATWWLLRRSGAIGSHAEEHTTE